MAEKSKTPSSANAPASTKSNHLRELDDKDLSLSGQLQISNFDQIQSQLDALVKNRILQLEVQLTGEGADLLRNPQLQAGTITIQANTASSAASSKTPLFDSSAQNRFIMAASNSIAQDAGEG